MTDNNFSRRGFFRNVGGLMAILGFGGAIVTSLQREDYKNNKPLANAQVLLYDAAIEAKREIYSLSEDVLKNADPNSEFYESFSKGVIDSLAVADNEVLRISRTDDFKNYQSELKRWQEEYRDLARWHYGSLFVSAIGAFSFLLAGPKERNSQQNSQGVSST